MLKAMIKKLSALLIFILIMGIFVPVSANQASYDVEIVFSWPIQLPQGWQGTWNEIEVTLLRNGVAISTTTVPIEEDEIDDKRFTFGHNTTAYRTGNVIDFDGQGYMIDMMSTHNSYSIDIQIPEGLAFSDQGMRPPYLDFYAIIYDGEWAGGFAGKPGIIMLIAGPRTAIEPVERVLPEPSSIGIIIDGVAIQDMDVAPVIRDGRTFAPVRALVEALGSEANWDNEARAVNIIHYGSTRLFDIQLTIDSHLILFYAQNGSLNIFENDVAAIIYQDRTMLPVRAIAEIMGFEVEWDGENQNVIITT